MHHSVVNELKWNLNKKEQLANNFRRLVEKHYILNRQVSQYAELINK